ncbi:hypothetical protein BJ508DRAFT_312843 [Ascobolus immersus RN42]|uniref:FHA domain-containing protein n=1 Tax=Ascobolus immersus RN42 TaxID=1160509 RepID=A0A3N4HQY8_ASCIM|nr:hypothetical protein BJ508DRAFT_312843 [Ascobolus immersus RN42]
MDPTSTTASLAPPPPPPPPPQHPRLPRPLPSPPLPHLLRPIKPQPQPPKTSRLPTPPPPLRPPLLPPRKTPRPHRPSNLSPPPAPPTPVRPLPHPLPQLNRSYPTPIPPSPLGTDLTSSPPSSRKATTRQPLGGLLTVCPPSDGAPLTLGRSSLSSDYQLSSNRLISRVHVRIKYHPDPFNPRLEIVCEGWNGITIHCAGQKWEMKKGDEFFSGEEGVEVLVDVVGCRVRVGWPGVPPDGVGHGSGRKGASSVASSPAPPRRALWDEGRTSPAREQEVSPTESQPRTKETSPVPESEDGIKIFEDSQRVDVPTSPVSEEETQQVAKEEGEEEDEPELPTVKSEAPEETAVERRNVKDVSDSSDLDSLSSSLFNEQENRDAVPPLKSMGVSTNYSDALHSFAVAPTSPPRIPAFEPPRQKRRSRVPSSEASYEEPEEAPLTPDQRSQILNNLTNRLAFSRASSMPLSSLFSALPSTLHPEGFTKERLQDLLESCAWIGKIKREGKDARGKRLEDMFFYEAELDEDEGRRKVWLGVVDSDDEGKKKPKEVEKEGLGEGWGLGLEKGGRGLRGCRKVHKQYYWKRPRKVGSGHH